MRASSIHTAVVLSALIGCATTDLAAIPSEECHYLLPAFFGEQDEFRAIRQGDDFHAVQVPPVGPDGESPDRRRFAELVTDVDSHWYRIDDTAYAWFGEGPALRFPYSGYLARVREICSDCEVGDSIMHPAPGLEAECIAVDAEPISLPDGLRFQDIDPAHFK